MNTLMRAAFAALASAALAIPVAAAAQPAGPAPSPTLPPGVWPQARSDLRADPTIRFGALPNGMRYAIMKNATPPGQVAMRLRFAVGSLMERDDQQGLAHFLEHMAFNGSAKVPTRGEMTEDLERLGLAFGADTNAGTGFDETVYKFNLPRSDDKTVDTSLMLLREIAGNLTLDQKAMDEERGVILSEERLRDSPAYRQLKSLYGFTMEGQRPPERFPIGLVPVIQDAKRDLIADIYHRYYRPERATLIIVGDIDPDAIEAKIKSQFSDWQGQGPAGADPDLGQVKSRATDYHLFTEAGVATTVDLSWITPPDLTPDTLAKRQKHIVEALAFAVLNRRLGEIARAPNPPFISAAAVRGDALRAEKATQVIVNAEPDHWKEGLAAVETEVRRATQFGVRPDELSREIAETDAALKAAVQSAATRQTPAMADELVGTLSDDIVETSPADDLALFEAATKDLKPEAVSDALKGAFTGAGPLVFVSTPAPIDGGVAAVKTAFEAASTAPVTAAEAPRKVEWPYGSFGPGGKVEARKQVADLDTTFVTFANGVRLTVKPTKFTQDQVLVKVRFGQGLEGLAPDRQAITWAGGAFAEGGLRQISAEDRERALTGLIYGVNFGAENDAFTLSGVTRTEDAPTQLQVLAAYMADPGWRPEAMTRWKTAFASYEDQLDATDSNVMGRDLNGLLHSGDRRWTFPSKADIAAASTDDLKRALGPSLGASPIEVVMVGDITVDAAIQDVAQTFGALPKRPAPPPPAPPAVDPKFPAAIATPIVETHSGRPDQGIAVIAWPTDDYYADPQAARVNTLMTEVMKLRLIDTLRLREGVTYSPTAEAGASFVFPHYGYILAEMEAPPTKLDGFFTDMGAIAADLKTKPVTDDELARAKTPAVQALEKARATNGYWLSALSGAEADPRRLEIVRTAEASLQRVTAADIEKAAKTYLRQDTAWRLEIRPKAVAAETAAASASTPAPSAPAPPAVAAH